MKNFFRLSALCCLGFFAWTCNVQDSPDSEKISLTLSDAIKAILKTNDTVVVTRFNVKGSGPLDTTLVDTLVKARYTSPSQLQNIKLPPPTLQDFMIVFEVYRDGNKILEKKLEFKNGNPGIPVDVPIKTMVTLQPKTLTLYIGGPTGTLLATVVPSTLNQVVTWSSSDSTVASVSSGGVVMPIKAGHAFIRARAPADTNAWDTASVNIQLSKPTSVQILNASPLFLPVNDSTTTLEAQIYPSGSAQGVSWSAADTSIALVDNQGRLRTLKLGQTKITATVKADTTLHAGMDLSVVQPKHVDSISAAPDSLLLYTGGAPGQLTVIMKPLDTGNVAQYRSGDVSIAAVSGSGKISAVAPGTAKIFVNPLGIAGLQDSCIVTVKKDAPVLSAGNDRQINLGDTAMFSIQVAQAYGSVQVLKWDLNGDGVWEDSTETSKSDTSLIVTYRYAQAGTFQAAFYVKDGEGNAATLTRRVVVGSKAPFVDIVKPNAKDTTLNANHFTLTYLVDTIQFTKALALQEGFNHIVVADTNKNNGLIGTDTVDIRVDTKAPVVKVTSPGKGFITKNASVTVTWTVDGGNAQSNSESLAGKQDSIKIIRSAFDSVGNQGSDTVVILRDTIPPAAPVFTATGASSDTTNQRRPIWLWKSGGGGNHSFRLSFKDPSGNVITDTTFTDTIFQPKLSQPDGKYSLAVSEFDLAGNASPFATRNVVIHTVGPVVHITSPAAGFVTNQNSVPVSWTVDGVAQTSQTSEDVSGKTGSVMIRRQATDGLGNIGADSVAITVDRSAPNAPLITAPATPTRNGKPTWIWSTGGGGGNGAFQYQLDTTAAVTGTALSFTPANALSDGTHTLKVQERNNIGTWSAPASSSVLIKSAPLAPAVLVNAALTNTPKWTWTPGGGGNGNFQYQLDSAGAFTATTATQYSPTLTSGSHTLCVQEQDVLGFGAPGCKSLVVDVTAPSLAITAPIGMAKVFSGTPAATGTASDANGIKTSTYTLNGGSAQPFTVTSGAWSFAPAWVEGQNVLAVTVTDNAGNSNNQSITVYKRSKVVFVIKGASGTGTSWANAYGELSQALDTSKVYAAGTQIWVGKGTYKPAAADSFGFQNKYSVSLYGGFAGDGSGTSLNGRDFNLNPSILHSYSLNTTWILLGADNTVVNGFVFEAGGYGTSGGVNVNIVNCIFRNFIQVGNTPLLFSGGSTTVDSCSFVNNSYMTDGAIEANGGQLTINHSQFQSNTSDENLGGGLMIFGSTVYISNSSFSGNEITDSGSLQPSQIMINLGSLTYQSSTTTIQGGDAGIINNGGSVIKQ